MQATPFVRPAKLRDSGYWRLTVRLLLLFAAAWILAAGIGWIVLSDAATQRAQDEMDLYLVDLVEQAEEGSVQSLVDRVTVHSRESDGEDGFVLLLAPDGKLLAGREGDTGTAYLTRQIDEPWGRVRVGRAHQDIEEPVIEAMMVFLGGGLAILLIAAGGGFLFSRAATRRLALVQDTLEQAAHGNLAARVALDNTSDDIGKLAGSVDFALSRLQASYDALRQAGTDIAHELRTPLNRAILRLDRLAKQPNGSDETDAAIEDLHGLARLIDTTLSIAALESRGLATDEQAKIDLADIVSEIETVYRAVFEEVGGSLEVESKGDSSLVTGNRQLLLRLVSILLENALTHGGSPAQVTLRLHTARGSNRLSVCDRGPGIPETERDRVLARFTRGSHSRDTPGLGLGLSMAKAIAQAHGARLLLTDNRPGLCATIEWPGAASASRG